MKYKRCHVCPFNQHNNQCHFKTGKKHYHRIEDGFICPLTEKIICKLVKEPEPIPEPVKSEIEIRRENVKQFRDQLKAIAKDLNDD